MPDSFWKWIGIPIWLFQLESEPWSPASPPEASVLSCQAYFRLLRCPSWLDRSPDVAEQTKVFNDFPSLNLRTYPSFPLQLEKNHQTSRSLKEDAWFPWTACREIPCSQTNRYGELICLTEVQRVPQKSLTSLEEHWCHRRNVKYLEVAQINTRLSPIPLHWLQKYSLVPIKQDKWLDFL